MKAFKNSWALLVVIFFTLSVTLSGCGGGGGSGGTDAGAGMPTAAGTPNTPSTLEAAAMPAFAPPGGTYGSDQAVSINSATAGATIYYTTDGSSPTSSSAAFVSPISIAGNGTTMTLKAIAVKAGMADSAVASATYTIAYAQTVATPSFSSPAGTYATDQSITLTSATSGATIYYTTDGSAPTTASPVFSGPISVAGNGTTMTIKAIAVKAGMMDSAVAAATYTIIKAQTVATPTFSTPAGTYSTDQSVTINSLTTGATIYYTTDGSAPTTASPVFSTPISIAGNGKTMTIRALAVKAGMTDSAIGSATYTITYMQAAATPTFSSPAGTYTTHLSVTLNSATSGATIYYTTDGSTPTTASAAFSSPIAVANGATVTIKALAVKAGMTDSAIASATYVVNSNSVVFSYPPNSSSGGLIQSSWVAPNGSDQDMYAYKDFTLTTTQAIREIDWRGGYIQGGVLGRATDFTITIFASIAGGSQPAVTTPDTPETYLAKYTVGGNAGETPAGSVNGVPMYDYKFILPTPFQAAAGTKYWLRIEAAQNTYPDWGIAVGTGGNGMYFRFSTGLAAFSMIPGGDTAFSLLK